MKVIKQMWKNVNNWWIHAKGIGGIHSFFFFNSETLQNHKKLLKTQGQIQPPDCDMPIFCWEILRKLPQMKTFMKMDIAWSAQSHLMGSLSNLSSPSANCLKIPTTTVFLLPGNLRLSCTNSPLPCLPTICKLVNITCL